MATLRTDETKAAYDAYQLLPDFTNTCVLCAAPALKTFAFWKIVKNIYPYDRIAAVHHMIVPLRHAVEAEMTEEEWQEYKTIKRDSIQAEYEFILEPTNKKKSIPAHFHLHLLVLID